MADTEIQVVMKTLGLSGIFCPTINNIDQITSLYGKQLMQAVVTLESENAHEVKEQALCMLANMDGDASKKLIVDNEDMLKKLSRTCCTTILNSRRLQCCASRT